MDRTLEAFSVRAAAVDSGSRVAVVQLGPSGESTQITWSELAHKVDRVAQAILQPFEGQVGWQEGLAVMARAGLPTVTVALACLEKGWTFVPVHPRWSAEEADDWAHRMACSGPALEPGQLLSSSGAARRREGMGPEEIEGPGVAQGWISASRGEESTAVLLPTSGSSARPKGVEISRRALLASAEASALRLGWQDSDRWLLTLPMAHVGGLSVLTRCLQARQSVVLPPPEARGFEAEAVWDWLHAGEVGLLSVVPTMLRRLMALGRRPPPTLRAILVGGASAPLEMLAAARTQGWPVLATYGLTEACSQVATQSPATLDGQVDSGASDVGRPLDGCDVRLVGPGGAVGSEGILEIRGPMMASAYRGHRVETSDGVDFAPGALLDAEGWFRTGDVARLDDQGCLEILGRHDNVIVTGGENVHPVEVEQALERHPRVAEAAVLGTADPEWGQAVTGLLVATPGGGGDSEPLPGLEDIRTFTTPGLASYKRPRRLAWVESLPRTASGKLDRLSLLPLVEG